MRRLPSPRRLKGLHRLVSRPSIYVYVERAGFSSDWLQLLFLGERAQGPEVSLRHGFLGFDLDGGVVAQNEVDLKARARAPMAHRLAGGVIAKGDQFVQEPRLAGDPEFRRTRFDEAALESGRDADVKGVVFRRNEGLARYSRSASRSCTIEVSS